MMDFLLNETLDLTPLYWNWQSLVVRIIHWSLVYFLKNCNQHGFVNDKSTLSNILQRIDIINEYLMEGDKVEIFT